MKSSQYCRVEAPKSRCPSCNNGLVLLQDIKIRPKMPMFYICFDCERIFEVGRDEVYPDLSMYRDGARKLEQKRLRSRLENENEE